MATAARIMAEPLPAELPSRWRQEAEVLRRHGFEEAARVKEIAADELTAVLRTLGERPLTREQVALLRHCSRDTVSRLTLEGRLRNVGRRGRPRYRLGDVIPLAPVLGELLEPEQGEAAAALPVPAPAAVPRTEPERLSPPPAPLQLATSRLQVARSIARATEEERDDGQ